MVQLKRKSEVLDSPISRTTKKMQKTNLEAKIESLPKDLLIEIIAKVASSSIADLFNLKLATKKLHQASEEGYIYRHVSFQDLSKIPWKNNPKFWSFIEDCNSHGNRESLYMKGILDFFSLSKEASGLAHLKAAAEKGLPEACYVYGVVSYSGGSKEEGVKFLRRWEGELGVGKMGDCRRRVRDFIWSFWIRKEISYLNYGRSGCLIKGFCRINLRRRISGWNWSDGDDCFGAHTCEACKWSGEVMWFCNMLKTGRYN